MIEDEYGGGGKPALEDEDPKLYARLLKIAISLGVVLVLAIIALVLQPTFSKSAAQQDLDNIVANTGTIMPANAEVVAFSGATVETANSSQKALSEGGQITDPAMFIFRSDKAKGDLPVLDFYLDFSEQRGRDAFIFNSDTLQGMVESGQVELRVHALLGGRAYSMYGAEALAETFATSPHTAWDTLLEILKQSAHGTSLDDYNATAQVVADAANKAGSTKVDISSIQNGTFAAWIVTVGNDPKLMEGIGLPLIIVDGQSVNLTIDELNDSNIFRSKIVNQLK